MKKKSLIPLSITFLTVAAMTASAQGRMTETQLLEYATSLSPCGEGLQVQSARYASETSIEITCATPGGVPDAGLGGAGIAVGAGVVLAAIASGGSSNSTSDTQ